ncbi:ABC transporter [Caldanaerobius fijiensis DSM 17918]|uniref:ABC transporter n=1 Tax=Caldanaerobius fijiensis DSM 17918 TaxID=1121256 RepID=A0A1M4X301_9THEO|nr:ABC transporter transmembrane domain-containing protein [Caldanaerobius fijiensis]SHE87777.1 ABC transporter [Caldanaerobius fijiensis DSM 17918]
MSSENKKIISFMFSCVKKQWELQLPGMLCSAVSSVLGIVGTSIFALLVDKVLMGGNRKLLWPVQLTFISSVFAGFLLNMMAAYLFSIAGNAERLSLRQRFFAHILRLPNHFFEVNKPGEIFSRLMDDVNRVGYSIFEGVTNFIISVFTLILLYSWMFYVDYRLTFMALMLIPLFLIVDKRIFYRVEKYNRWYQKEMGETNGELQQSLAGILAIKTLNLQDWAHMSFFEKCKALARTGFSLDMSFAGKQGEQLSGGERQRVCIAQALLRDAPILLLDEPTSALDMGTERALMEFLRQYRQQKTIILVTHRPSAMEWCDQVVVLNQGRVVAQGDFVQIKKDYESVLAV